jgi:putative hydrolase of the HAD superfamily
MIKAVLFDLDETLFDRTGSLRAFLADQHKRHEALAHVDVEDFTDMFLTLDGRGTVPKAEVYPSLLGHLGQVDDTMAATMADEYFDGFPQFAKMLAGCEALLLYLRQKQLHTGIISNGMTDPQMRTIYALKLDLLVDGILVSEQEGIRKPDPEIFWRAASRLSLKPEDCLFVGDNPVADILGAHGAGMSTIWVPNGTVWPDDAATNPGLEVASLKAVLKMLVKIGL